MERANGGRERGGGGIGCAQSHRLQLGEDVVCASASEEVRLGIPLPRIGVSCDQYVKGFARCGKLGLGLSLPTACHYPVKAC